MQKAETTVLGNSTDEHQKAFIELLGTEAIHIGYVMLASDGIWKLDTSNSDERAYNLDTTDYPRLPLFTRL